MKLQISILLFMLFASTAFSQIKYFPTVFLDIDQDGIEDVIFKYNVSTQSMYWYSIKANDETETEIEFAANGSYAKYLDFNDTIDENLNWQAKSLYLYSYYENKPKQWGTGNNYFIGIRIKKNGAYYYGWIRFNSKYGKIIERDFAIQPEPGKAIKAGEGIKSITPVYEGVKSNENTIAIITDFFPPFHKTYVAEYRLYIVKCSDTGELNTDKLLSVPNSNYQVVAPGEKRYSVELNENLPTIDNDTLNLSEFYQICVLAYSNNNDTFPHSYILTDTVTVNVLTVSVDKPAVFDTGDNENSKDIQVKFAKSSKESFLKDYKLMIVPADSAATFNLKKAIAVPEQFTHAVTPSNDSVYTVENTDLTDIYGNEIQQNKCYNAFILSAHDGTHSNISSLSPPSNLFVLNNPDYLIVGQKDGGGVIYHKFDSEIHTLDFDNDGEIDITTEVIDYIEAPGFTRINIAVFSGKNTEIICSDNNLAKDMEENSALFSGYKWSSDKLTLYRYYSGGNGIGEFRKRYGFIGFRKIVKNDTIYGWLKTGCCYKSILEFAYKKNSMALDKNNNSEWSDINLDFYPPVNSFIKEYRIFIIKKDNANEVDINKLLSASKSNYQIVTPGASEYHINLKDNLLTIDNDSIAAGESYQIYILSYSTDTDSFPHSFFKAGNFTVNTFLPQVEKPVVIDAGDRGNSEDIQITFFKNIKENFVKTYKILILPADSTVSFNLEKAVSIPEKFLHSATPINDSLYILKKLQLTDIYGNSIKQNKPYNVFILSVHDGIKTNISSLSSASNLFVLNNPGYFCVGQTNGECVVYAKYNSNILDLDNNEKADLTVISNEHNVNSDNYSVDAVVRPGDNTELVYSTDYLAENIEKYIPVFPFHKWSLNTLRLRYIDEKAGVNTDVGEFNIKGNGYVGFRKVVKNDTIFGWIKISNLSIIEEFAFKDCSYQLSFHPIKDFAVYPNPNSDRILNIQIKEYNEGDDYSIDILNSAGIQIKSYVINEKLTQISIATLRRGFYYVRMRSPEKQTTQKLIVL